MRVHFVYAVPNSKQLFARPPLRGVEFRARKTLDRYLPSRYRRGRAVATKPLPPPFSITTNLYSRLSREFDTLLYDWLEPREIRVRPEDLVIGHPHANPVTPMQRLLEGPRRCRLQALIFPLHHGIPDINEYAIRLVSQADLVFGIMGSYWYDTLDRSAFGAFKHKIVRVDLGLEASDYPFVRSSFNPPGSRRFLYIGTNRPEKGTGVLSATLAKYGPERAAWIGGGPEIPGLRRLYERVPLTETLMSQLQSEFDVFVNTSISDANPSTILEAFAWGFPVACTPQSGYYNMRHLTELSLEDLEFNRRRLEELDRVPSAELMERAVQARAMVETEHNWDKVLQPIVSKVRILHGL